LVAVAEVPTTHGLMVEVVDQVAVALLATGAQLQEVVELQLLAKGIWVPVELKSHH
jgi:hypothetical protein